MKMNDYEFDATIINAMQTLGDAFDIAQYNGYNPDTFLQIFIASNCATFFENNHPRYVVGMSGYELFCAVLNNLNMQQKVLFPINSYNKSQFYWVGYFLAYFQRRKNLPFREISLYLSMNDLLMFYQTLHTVSNEYAFEEVNRFYEDKQVVKLKEWRNYRGLTQNQLAFSSNVSKESIRSYELGINKVYNAKYDTVQKLAKALDCNPYEIADYPITWTNQYNNDMEQALLKMQTRTLQQINQNRKELESRLNDMKYQHLYQNLQSKINDSINALQSHKQMTYQEIEKNLISYYNNQINQAQIAISEKVAKQNQIKSLITEGVGMYLKLSGQKEMSIAYDTAMLLNSKNVTEALFRAASLIAGLANKQKTV